MARIEDECKVAFEEAVLVVEAEGLQGQEPILQAARGATGGRRDQDTPNIVIDRDRQGGQRGGEDGVHEEEPEGGPVGVLENIDVTKRRPGVGAAVAAAAKFALGSQ